MTTDNQQELEEATQTAAEANEPAQTQDQNEDLSHKDHLEAYKSDPEKLEGLYFSHQKTIKESIARKERIRDLESQINEMQEEKKKAAMDAQERERYEQEQKQKFAEELEQRIQRLQRENEELNLLNVFSRHELHDPKDALRSYRELPEEQRANTTADAFIEQLRQTKSYLFKQAAPAAPAQPEKTFTPTTATPVVPGKREKIEGVPAIPTAPRTKDDKKALDAGWAKIGKASK